MAMAMRGLLLRAVATSKAAPKAAPVLVTRAFSGNVEYPRIEGSVADITKALNSIGARLSIPTAALYLTEDKINHVVREMKGKDELREVQRSLLLCDAKLVYPSQFAVGTFVAAAIKEGVPELALELLQKAENLRHYLSNQSVVRLARYYAEQEDQEQVEAVWKIVADKGLKLTTKAYHFRAINAKNQGKFDEAVTIAKEAAEVRQINSNLIIQLLSGLEGDELKQQIPLAKYLAAKGEVYANARLTELLAEQ